MLSERLINALTDYIAYRTKVTTLGIKDVSIGHTRAEWTDETGELWPDSTDLNYTYYGHGKRIQLTAEEIPAFIEWVAEALGAP